MSSHSEHEKALNSPSLAHSPQLERPSSPLSQSAPSAHSTPVLESQQHAVPPAAMKEALKKTVLSGTMLIVVFWICALW